VTNNATTRLGQLLIQRGLLARPQLVKALSSQMVYGGRLGTNLIENEFVSLQDVSETLAAQHGVSSATRELLADISTEALSLLPQRLAEQYSAVALAVEGETLLVAMMDPGRERVAELSHEIMRPIRPFATPELRLLYLLEHHYAIPRPNRFLRVPDGGGQPAGRRRYLQATVTKRDTSELQPAAPESQIDVAPLPGQTNHYHSVAGRGALTNPDDDTAHERFERLPVTPGATSEYGVADDNQRTLHHILRALDSVDSGEGLARLLVRPLCADSAVSVLFWVRGEMAIGCCAHGVGAPLSKLQQLVLPLQPPSLMRWATEMHSLVRAQGTYDTMQHEIARFLDTPFPKDVCVAPVILGERVVNLIVVHSHSASFQKSTLHDYKDLAGAATNAYANLKSRIRAG
jgi:hypothetical protein